MRSLSEVTSTTLTTLTTLWVVLFTVVGTVDLYLDSSVELAPVRTPLIAGWALAAAAAVLTIWLPENVRPSALLVLSVALAAGTVITREVSGLVAPWIQITIVAGIVLVATGLLLPYQVVPWVSVAVVLLVLVPQRYDEVVRDGSPVQLGVPIMEAALIVGLGLLGALIRGVLVQSAARTDDDLERAWNERRDALAERSRQDALATQVSLLHDTALNTLAAIALGASESEDAARRRCQQDAERLRALTQPTQPPGTSLDQGVRWLERRASLLGLHLDAQVDAEPGLRLPDPVTSAVIGACDEALLNVTKHAGVRRATLRVSGRDDAVTAVVADNGVGFDTAAKPGGLGSQYSIDERLASVGGESRVESTPGQGTVVTLSWRKTVAGERPFATSVAGLVQRLLVLFLVATTTFNLVAIVAEWSAFEQPIVALLGTLVLGGWGLAVMWLLLVRRWIATSVGVITVALACVAPFWTVASDQYCASSYGSVGFVDPRLPLVIAVILTSRVWQRAIAAVPAILVALVAAGSLWGQAFTGCGGGAISASMYALAILVSALLAGRTLNRQTAALDRGVRQRDEAEAASMRAAAARAEQQEWLAPAVDSCLPLLTSIGAGDGPLDSEVLREQCRTESAYLRALVSVAAAPVGVRDMLRDVVQAGRAADADVVVRGEPSSLGPLADDGVASLSSIVGSVLPTDLRGATRVSITCSGDGTTALVVIHAVGLGLDSAGATVDGSRDDDGIDALVADIDGLWVELTWTSTAVSDSTPVGAR